ncbi:MAG: MAPEG family protein [Gammaproteobacteria bacterium]|nr:MAPEG family protein [Gammaproteobacteria bacterium]NVK86760.1 MAPEG family protein [Gammaproteobacteria bacterium]
MTADLLLGPVLANILLTFIVQLTMYRQRMAAIKHNKVRLREIAHRQQLEQQLPQAQATANNFLNQFELPVIFYAIVGFLMIQNWGGWLPLLLASVFVLSRTVHAYIHCTSNRVKYRFLAYVFGTWILYGLFAYLAYRWIMHLIY